MPKADQLADGDNLAQKNNLRTVVEQCQAILKSDVNDVDANFVLGSLYLQLGQPMVALKYF